MDFEDIKELITRGATAEELKWLIEWAEGEIQECQSFINTCIEQRDNIYGKTSAKNQ